MHSLKTSKVSILMATFNGEKYIENQILSLIGQTFKDWKLTIHDDGSTDGTLALIRKYMERDERIELLNDGITCGGPGKNFLHLLKYANADLVVFCDQDDIWFEHKLATLVKLMENEEQICAAYCNAYAYNGEVITAQKITLFQRSGLKDSLFLNGGVQGCSLIFNRALVDALTTFPEYVFMHDHLITMAAVSFGKLKCTDKSLMLYRQHDNNVTGNVPTSFMQRVKTFFDRDNSVIESRHYKANESFYTTYRDKMSTENKRLFESYLSYPNQNLWKRLSIIWNNSFKIGDKTSILLLKTLIRKPI